jgi:hypothetical protein
MKALYEKDVVFIIAYKHPKQGPKIPVYSLREEGDMDIRKPARKRIVRSRLLSKQPLNNILMKWG